MHGTEVIDNADAEFVTAHWLVVPVVRSDKVVRIRETYRPHVESGHFASA